MAAIVIVEDEPWLGELYMHCIERAGHSATWCRDGYEAVDLPDTVRCDVLLLDLFLPWGNGLQLLHELRSYEPWLHTPVILCSVAPPRLSNAERAAYGIADVVDKTIIKPAGIVASINRILQHANSKN